VWQARAEVNTYAAGINALRIKSESMRFSLIVATLGRTTELRALLESLERQIHRDFEVIIVDQNTDGRLLPILSPFEGRLEIRRMISAPGLSRARNLGLQAIAGEVVCFPDDDCSYPEDVLARVNELFTANPSWSGLIGDSIDAEGRPTLPWRDRPGKLMLPMSWRRAISYALFLRSSIIREIGGFDESLGLGAGTPWGSGEDNDLILRTLKTGRCVQYDPNIRIYHPRLFPAFNKSGWSKRYSYAMGDGKLLQKHPMPIWWNLLFFSVPLGRAVLAGLRINRREVYFHWLTFRGRLKGFLSAKSVDNATVPFPLSNSTDAPVSNASPETRVTNLT
jgi:glycosyltransferase involved in cell wall biosynthesis